MAFTPEGLIFMTLNVRRNSRMAEVMPEELCIQPALKKALFNTKNDFPSDMEIAEVEKCRDIYRTPPPSYNSL
ncbi:hypothetical protein BV898_16539 [Hypsibius exemplaris]|uniref:Uncharacterized protein n=1 Tax=Hypsibius exemplaris TaxID=2072580 RepID=A0A9X6NKD3_HYPEX|nr:hypothetical protein BV898_16539 [Hypsibius exemplaris]